MKTALLLNNEKYTARYDDTFKAVIFELKNNNVVGVENEVLTKRNTQYLTSWAESKGINEICILKSDNNTGAISQGSGIVVKKYEDLDENHVFRSFVI